MRWGLRTMQPWSPCACCCCLLLPHLKIARSTRTDFQIEGVVPHLAIGAVTLCLVLIRASRLLHSGWTPPPIDCAIFMGKYEALDASEQTRVVQLYAEAGFPSDQTKFGVANYFVTAWAKVT